MRRGRSITIYANDEFEFCKEYDKFHKSSNVFPSRNNILFEESEDNEQDQEEAVNVRRRGNYLSKTINFLKPEDEKTVFNNYGFNENLDNFKEDYNSDDENLVKSEDSKPECSNENGIQLLCVYLKNTISHPLSKNFNNNIFYKKKDYINSLSGNAIHDVNVQELLSNIIRENNVIKEPNEENDENNNDISVINDIKIEDKKNCINSPSIGSCQTRENSLKEFILKNMPTDCTIKIMVMSNSSYTKGRLLETFLEIKRPKSFKEKEDNDNLLKEETFKILKKQSNLFTKNVTLQYFDTTDKFLSNPISFVYFKLSTCFFIFIDATLHGALQYLDNILNILLQYNQYTENKTIVLFGVNLLFENDCTVDKLNLREYALENDMMFIPIKKEDFTIRNSAIFNLFNLILLKRIDNRISYGNSRKNSKEKSLLLIKTKLAQNIIESSEQKKFLYDLTKINAHNSLGFNKTKDLKDNITLYELNEESIKKYLLK